MVDATGTEAVIQGVTAPMVAVPGPGQALMARSAGFGGTMPGMTAKIALRGGNQEAFRRWIANRNDVITANGLDQLMDNNQMPTLAAVGERFPDLSSEQKQVAMERALQQYQGENTALYFLVKESVIISGPYEQLDRGVGRLCLYFVASCAMAARGAPRQFTSYSSTVHDAACAAEFTLQGLCLNINRRRPGVPSLSMSFAFGSNGELRLSLIHI